MPKAEEIEFPFRTREELDSYLPYLLNRLSNRWSVEQNAVLSDQGISGTRMRILSCLSAHGELTINQLSALSVTEQSTTSRTVESLVEAGLARRYISNEDQRLRTVRLSAKGRRQLTAIAPTINELYQNLVTEVDGESLQVCVTVLQKILTRIRQNDI